MTAIATTSSEVVWPIPHTTPTSAERQMLRRWLTIVETAARWSTSSAWRSPRKKPRPRMASGEPVTSGSHPEHRFDDERQPRERDDGGARDGREAGDAPVERQAIERPARIHQRETDRGQHRGEADAEREDQREPERDAAERDRTQHDDQRGGTRQ